MERGSDSCRSPGATVRRRLELIAQLEQRGREAQRTGYQPVREPHVLGQQRPVQVGPNHAAAAGALVAVLAVVAVALEDPAEGLSPRTEVRPPAVVLKPSHDRALAGFQLDLDGGVSD